ncbi:MAG: methyltransferase [Gammaproteobacteria bacterium]
MTPRSGGARARSCVERLTEWALDAAGILGWSRPFRHNSATATLEQLLRDAAVIAPHEDGWRSTVRVSSIGEQLYFHSAYPTDADDAVFFGPDTYRFMRAVVGALATGDKPHRIIEIGCGAAPAAIALALRYPDADVVAADINDAALALAAVNAQLAGVANVRTVKSDVLAGAQGDFDLIVSNPPYIADSADRTYRDGGGNLGADISLRILDESIVRLAARGRIMLYTGSAIVAGQDLFKDAARGLLEHAGLAFDYDELDPDVFGDHLDEPAYRQVERIAAVMLNVQKN